MSALMAAAPFPPPVDVLADDGLAHVRWRFARDFRLCAGADMIPVEYALDVALPNLAARGRLDEAVRRMSNELLRQGFAGGDFLSPFARQWLGRPNMNSDLDARAAAARALAGDGAERRPLEAALLVPSTAALAARSLTELGADPAAVLGAALAGEALQTMRQAAVAATVAVPAIAVACAPCAEALAVAALDPPQPAAARVAMLEILGRLERTEPVAKALAAAASEGQPATIRGAALLAAVTPGSGRPGMVRLTPLLRDRSPEIRAAAVAGLLRAGRDGALDHLYLLPKEKDPRPLAAAAAELGRLSSDESAVMLGKLLKKTDPVVRRAVVRALASRSDLSARELVDPILAVARRSPGEDLEIRRIALAGASSEDLNAMATDPRIGREIYRALLAAGMREEAARWLLANLVDLPAEERIGALGEWIASPSPRKGTTTARR
jgi:hypothetical protein